MGNIKKQDDITKYENVMRLKEGENEWKGRQGSDHDLLFHYEDMIKAVGATRCNTPADGPVCIPLPLLPDAPQRTMRVHWEFGNAVIVEMMGFIDLCVFKVGISSCMKTCEHIGLLKAWYSMLITVEYTDFYRALIKHSPIWQRKSSDVTGCF